MEALLSLLTFSLVSITPWYTNMGYQNCFISAAFIGMGISLTFLIFIKYGKRFRQRSAATYWMLIHDENTLSH